MSLAVAASALVLTACAREWPVYNVSNHPWPAAAQQWPLDRIERVIVFAGEDRGWKITSTRPGLLRGHLNVRGHTADVDILATQQGYSITLVSSQRLAQNGMQISHKYNQWARNLELDIDRRMNDSVLGIELKREHHQEGDSD